MNSMAELPKYSNPEVLARISGLTLRATRVVEGTVCGLHRSPFHGFNVEFAEYREYSPGDDLRLLDWRVLGRTDRFYIKQYEEESNLRATIVMDASASMRYGSGAMTKFDYAATLAASLATLLVEQQDPVGLALFDNQERSVLSPAATQSQLVQIIYRLEQAKPDRQTDLGAVLQTLSGKLKKRGMVIIISDLLTDLNSFYDGLSRLQYLGNEILVFQVLDKDELDLPFNDLVLFRDIEGSEELFAEPWAFRKAYSQAMQKFVEEVKDTCGSRGIDHLLLRTDDNLALALSHYLHRRESA
ncbi:MAG TPA: DUF58 domain-containing protein [Pirellulales bacterium]|jgi:uncharacterized protein (DUF58 family)|nr:DUF58 domain-containing protein [Pirellulales bacterium]